MRVILVLGLLLGSNDGHALNGLRPIGVSAESNALGGTGICSFYNYYDALYKNPAVMAATPHRVGQSQAVFGMTYGTFSPAVKATYGEDQEYKRPVNRTSALFPSAFGVGNKVNQRLAVAIGAYGGGGGADYGEKADAVYRAKSRTVAYSVTSGVSYGLTSQTFVGLNATVSRVDTQASNLSATTGEMAETGGKANTYGALVGVHQRLDALSWGLTLQPAQTALLEKARDIENRGVRDDLYFTAVPAEAALGVSWREPRWMAVAEYRFLQWSQAEFLKSVGWIDQHVMALGFEYGEDHRLRMGLNVSTDAVRSRQGTDGFSTTPVSGRQLVNLAGDAFATTSGLGVTNRHYTIGSGHTISKKLALHTAFQFMEPGSLVRSGYYNVPTGTKRYGWKSKFEASTLQLDLTYLW